jgi:hypothetical protein
VKSIEPTTSGLGDELPYGADNAETQPMAFDIGALIANLDAPLLSMKNSEDVMQVLEVDSSPDRSGKKDVRDGPERLPRRVTKKTYDSEHVHKECSYI